MDLRDYARVLRRRWLTAVITALVIVGAVSATTLLMTPQYTATTRLFFAVQGTESATDLAQGSTFAEKQMTSYEQVATSPLVLDPVITDLGLDENALSLANSVVATVPQDTVILEVAVTRVDRGEAARIANAIGTEMTKVAASLSPERQDGDQSVKATVLARAAVPTSQSSPDVPRNLALGIGLAVLLGVAAALVRNILDTRVRSESDVKAVTDRPLLGSISFSDQVASHPVLVADEPLSDTSESIRRLRTNLQFVSAGAEHKTLAVTSSVAGEGKSTTAINLAVTLADAGSRVLLIDADLRRPSVADYLGLEGRAGLTSVLIGRASFDDVVQVWRDSNLHVLPSGPVPPNPSELLGSTAMQELLPKLSESYDVVLLDSPPLLPVTDGAILARLTSGALLIVGADRVHRGQLAESLTALEVAGAEARGIVINKVAARGSGRYGYSGYHAYRPEPAPQAEPVPGSEAASGSGTDDVGPVAASPGFRSDPGSNDADRNWPPSGGRERVDVLRRE